MANQTLITNGAQVSQVEQLYFSPVAVVPPQTNIPLGTIYAFLSKVDPWTDDNNPPAPTEDQQSIKRVFKNMIAVKKIDSTDISPVIQRINWSSGQTYDYYNDTVDMFALDVNGNLVLSFYIINRYNQIFKCLWNNNDQPSTVEPYFQPGVYNTNNVFQGSDNYKWKYMYTVDSGSALKFLDNTWIPVPVGVNTPNPNTTAGAGSIDVINVTNGGALYDPANSEIYVTITGDGTGAVATADVLSGMNSINDITVNSPGSGYTYANVSITSSSGFAAQAFAPTSPIGGHGYDPISELGCTRAMFSIEFNGSESGIVPTDITYYQIGLLTNPTLNSLSADIDTTGYVPASGDIYATYTQFIVAPGFGVYASDETLYQGDINNPTFTGTVLDFNAASNIITVLNMSGTPVLNQTIRGSVTITARTLLQVTPPDFQIFSGYITYIENRAGVERSSDGIEQYKFVVGY
jgi:hypothetical protein